LNHDCQDDDDGDVDRPMRGATPSQPASDLDAAAELYLGEPRRSGHSSRPGGSALRLRAAPCGGSWRPDDDDCGMDRARCTSTTRAAAGGSRCCPDIEERDCESESRFSLLVVLTAFGGAGEH